MAVRLENAAMKIGYLAILLAALGLAGVVSRAGAQPLAPDTAPYPLSKDVVVSGFLPWGAQTRSKPISFKDLDLATRDGAQTLMHRIRAAAREVCEPPSTTPGDFKDRANYQRCIDLAVSKAVADVNSQSLQDVFYSTGRGTD
jgi:UrcA family protein